MLVVYGQFVLADECDLDQNSRIEENIKLQKKYPGSYLMEDNLVLVVPTKGGEVNINIGGCAHFGVTIEFKTKLINKNISENEFMDNILWLSKTYSQGIINQEQLKKTIKEKNWLQPKEGVKFYFFNYDGSPFEVYENTKNDYTIIGFSSYS